MRLIDSVELRPAPTRSRSLGAAAFWAVAAGYLVTMLGTTLPTPLYAGYQQRFGFSSFVLTAIYATYAFGVLATLIALGSLSDRIGRRPVLCAALALTVASAAVFALAQGVAALFAGRVLSGIAAGLYTGAASAALVELSPGRNSRRPALVGTASSVLGLGLGPLAAGLLAQYAPDPLRLVFLIDLAVAAAAGLAVAVIPEPARRRASLRGRAPVRLALPPAGWSVFGRLASAGFAGFALLGLFNSLAPSLLGKTMHIGSTAAAGAIAFLFLAASGFGQLALRRISERRAIGSGGLLVAAGVALVALAAASGSLALLILAALVGGLGQGLAFMGSLAVLTRQAPDHRRGAVMSSYFVAAYLGVAVPVLGMGILAGPLGIVGATVTFAAAIAPLALAVAVDALRPTSEHIYGPGTAVPATGRLTPAGQTRGLPSRVRP